MHNALASTFTFEIGSRTCHTIWAFFVSEDGKKITLDDSFDEYHCLVELHKGLCPLRDDPDASTKNLGLSWEQCKSIQTKGILPVKNENGLKCYYYLGKWREIRDQIQFNKPDRDFVLQKIAFWVRLINKEDPSKTEAYFDGLPPSLVSQILRGEI